MDEAAIVSRLRAAGSVFAEDEARLIREAARTDDELRGILERRVAGDPLEYILGWVDFCGLRVTIDAGVFVPRQRTSFLVELAAERADVGATVLDLCCGCGAVGLAISALAPGIRLVAADIEPVAVTCARRNVESAGGRVFEGDLFAALPPELRGTVQVIAANVPYVPTAAIALMPPEAREHEPAVTLDGGADGLDVLRRVAGQAPEWLADGGHLLIETSEDQAPLARDVFARAGFRASIFEDDERYATVVAGRL
jgi:release factor glutamine methyltransferase